MPTIEITDTTFSRLQSHATPLVDSVETALSKVLDLADLALGKAGSGGGSPLRPAMGAPDLTHTTLTSAIVDGKVLPPTMCNWNAFMMAMIEAAAAKLPAGSEIADLVIVNHVAGQKEDNGYKYLKGLGLSIQGQNSNNAWKAIAHVAKATSVKAEAGFYWSNHPKAAKPGETSRLTA